MRQHGKRLLKVLLPLSLLILAGCGQKAPPPGMEELWERIAAETAVPELYALGEKQRLDLLGLDSDQLPQAVVMVSRDPMALDEVWLLECADPETAERLETLAENHRESLCRQSRDYFPEQYALAEQAQVCREGVYLGFFLGQDARHMAEIFRKELE